MDWKVIELWCPAAGGVAYLVTVVETEKKHEVLAWDCNCKECRKIKRRVVKDIGLELGKESEEDSDRISVVIDI